MDVERDDSYAKDCLERGGILLYPSDTVYGLGCDPLNDDALQKLHELKGGRDEKGFLVLASDIEMVERYAHIPDHARKVANAFWPGPLTLILPAKETFSDLFWGKFSGTLAARIPKNDLCLELVRAFGKPIVSTSANLAGKETQKTVPEILGQFGEKKDMIDCTIDAGELPESKPSTLVDATGDELNILREGVISEEQVSSIV